MCRSNSLARKTTVSMLLLWTRGPAFTLPEAVGVVCGSVCPFLSVCLEADSGLSEVLGGEARMSAFHNLVGAQSVLCICI